MSAGARRAALALALAGALAAGCTRRPQLVPAGADSTGVRPDSFAVLARQAGDRGEAGEDEQAAAISARLVYGMLHDRPTAPWPERTHDLLDSLGIAAEVQGGDRAMVVNLFSRTEVEGASWPYLFWHDKGDVHLQAMESRGMKLHDLATRGFSFTGTPGDSAQVAVLWARRGAGGPQPVLTVWRDAHGRWDLAQTLGPDSLGGTGNGEFAGADSASMLTTRTYRPAPWFDECTSCPHIFHVRHFAWGSAGFVRLDDRATPSPYATFTAFIAALIAGDRDRANALVADPALVDYARRYGWDQPGRGRWRVAPETDESALEMVFFRGTNDAYRVAFEPRGPQWVVRGFESTERTIE